MATRSQLNLAHTHPVVFDEHRLSRGNLTKNRKAGEYCQEFLQVMITQFPGANTFARWIATYGAQEAFGALLGGILLYLVLYR